MGEHNGKTGLIPSDRVELFENAPKTPVSPKKPVVKKVKAVYTFKAGAEDELGFEAGDVIDVIARSKSGWWKGKLGGKEGIFPVNRTKPLMIPDEQIMHQRSASAGASGQETKKDEKKEIEKKQEDKKEMTKDDKKENDKKYDDKKEEDDNKKDDTLEDMQRSQPIVKIEKRNLIKRVSEPSLSKTKIFEAFTKEREKKEKEKEKREKEKEKEKEEKGKKNDSSGAIPMVGGNETESESNEKSFVSPRKGFVNMINKIKSKGKRDR